MTVSLKDKFISITDMRKNATCYIDSLASTWDKIIFKNNKPTAVLVDFNRYENMLNDENNNIEPLYWSEEVIKSKDHEDFISLLRSA